MAESVDAWDWWMLWDKRQIAAQAIKGVAEIEIYDHVTIEHRFLEASSGVDCCFKASTCPDSQQNMTEVDCKLVSGVAVGTLGGNATQS